MTKLFPIYVLIGAGFSLVSSFSWQTCSDTTEAIKVLSLDMTLDGTSAAYISGRGKVGMNITAPIQGKVTMWKKFFWGWSVIPCVENIGSCTYDDICALTPYSQKACPQNFIDNGIPCRCPILEGQYAAKRLAVDLSAVPHWIESGRYKVKISLTEDDAEILCLILNFSL